MQNSAGISGLVQIVSEASLVHQPRPLFDICPLGILFQSYAFFMCVDYVVCKAQFSCMFLKGQIETSVAFASHFANLCVCKVLKGTLLNL